MSWGVWVSLARASDVLVADDGCGVPDGFAPEKSKGLGMRIVVALGAPLLVGVIRKTKARLQGRRRRGKGFHLVERTMAAAFCQRADLPGAGRP